MKMNATWQRLLATTVISGAASFTIASPASAQQVQPPQQQPPTVRSEPPIPRSTPENTMGADQPESEDTATSTGSSGQTITVTGSRIARPDLTSSSPVAIVDDEQLELSGTQTVETLLNDLPQIVPGIGRSSNNPSGGGVASTLDLRGLGPTRTLILVDGDRIPPSTTGGTVDVSQIPTGLIERVDVVTGGASAVYGSDAISGVINFILKQDFQGLELRGQTSISERGDGFTYAVSGLVGSDFANGRGNIAVYGSFLQREEVSTQALDYSSRAAAVFQTPSGQIIIADRQSEIPTGSTLVTFASSATSPNGQIINTGTGTNFRNLSTLLPNQFGAGVIDADCDPTTAAAAVGAPGSNGLAFTSSGTLTTFNTGGNCAVAEGSSGRYDFNPANLLQLPYDRFNMSTIARYEFSDRTRARLFAAYTNQHLRQQLAPTPAGIPGTSFIIDPTRTQFIPAQLQTALNSRTFFTRTGRTAGTGALGGRFGTAAACAGAATAANQFSCTEVGAGNFNSPEVQAVLPGVANPANETVNFGTRFTATGPRIGDIESNSIIGRVSVEHDINEVWKIDGSLGWGQTSLSNRGFGNINRTAVEQGARGCQTSGTANQPGTGVLPNCLPVNIFNQSAITPAQLQFIQTDTNSLSRFEQTRASVNVSGQMWNLPGGPVGVAFGAEVRHDRGRNIPDDALQRGEIIGFNAQQPTEGEITVREVYGEVRLPLLGGDGFPDLLSVGLTGRYSEYSTVGGIFNYGVSAEFAPVPWVRFRGAYNKAARAPSVNELFQAGDQGFPAVTDPCNANLTPTAATQAACIANGVPAALLPTFSQANPQIQSFAFGQPDLSEEEAETYTAGVVVTPDWFPVGRFSLTADYYHIIIRGQIQALSAQFYINQCLTAATPVPQSCARINRDPNTGQIVSVNTGRRNSPDVGGPFETRGIDIGVNWVIPFDELFGGTGRLRFSNAFLYVLDYKVAGTEFVDSVGSGLGGITPEFANTFTAAIDTGPITVQGRYTYESGGQYSTSFAPVAALRVPDFHSVEMSVRYAVSENFDFTFIVSNLLDELPPQTIFTEQNNTFPSFFSANLLGRTYTASAKVRF